MNFSASVLSCKHWVDFWVTRFPTRWSYETKLLALLTITTVNNNKIGYYYYYLRQTSSMVVSSLQLTCPAQNSCSSTHRPLWHFTLPAGHSRSPVTEIVHITKVTIVLIINNRLTLELSPSCDK